MWITGILLFAAAQGIVNGYRHRGSSDAFSDYGDEEDLYRDLDYWNKKDQRLDTQAKAISAAEHSLAAARQVTLARKAAKEALAAAGRAISAAAVAAKHSKMAAHVASLAASRLAAHFSKVAAAAGAGPGSSFSGRSPGSSAGRRPGSSTGRRPGSSTGRGPGSSAVGGSKSGSSAVGARRPGSAAGGARPTISGTPTGSSKGGSSTGGSQSISFNIVLRFPSYHFTAELLQRSSGRAKRLESLLCAKIRQIFKRGEMLQCSIKSFKKGSLVTDFFLRFQPHVKDALARIKAAIKSGYLGSIPVQKYPVKVYNVKGAGKSGKAGCKPCKTLAPGVKLVSQSQCPTGYCATVMINPSQVMQAAAPAPPPAYPQMAAQPSYSSCPQMCQPPVTQYACPPACPPACCAMGKK